MLFPVGDRLYMEDETEEGAYFAYNSATDTTSFYGFLPTIFGGAAVYGPLLTMETITGEVGVGTLTPDADLHVSGGTGSVSMLLEADTNNDGEDNQPIFTFSQDGGQVLTRMGFQDGFNHKRLINSLPMHV